VQFVLERPLLHDELWQCAATKMMLANCLTSIKLFNAGQNRLPLLVVDHDRNRVSAKLLIFKKIFATGSDKLVERCCHGATTNTKPSPPQIVLERRCFILKQQAEQAELSALSTKTVLANVHNANF